MGWAGVSFVTAMLVAPGAAVAAKGADCGRILDGKATLVGEAMTVENGEKSFLKVRIERGQHTLVTLAKPGQDNVTSVELDGLVTVSTTTSPPFKTFTYAIADANGDLQSLGEGSSVEYRQTLFVDGSLTTVFKASQTIGPRSVRTISGCPIDAIRIHRDFVEVDGDGRRTVDVDYAPAIGFSLFSEQYVNSRGKSVTNTFTITAIAVE
jgi:hypothetical protein